MATALKITWWKLFNYEFLPCAQKVLKKCPDSLWLAHYRNTRATNRLADLRVNVLIKLVQVVEGCADHKWKVKVALFCSDLPIVVDEIT